MTRRTIATTFLAVLFLFALAPVALADPIGDATSGVGDALGGDGGATQPSGSEGEPSGSSGGGDPLGTITDVLGGDEEDPSSDDPVKAIQEEIDKTFNNTQDEVDKAASDPSGYAGGVTDSVDKTVKDTKKGLKNRTERTRPSDPTPVGTLNRNPAFDDVRASGLAGALERDGKAIALLKEDASSEQVAPEVSSPSVIAEIGRVAAEAAEQVAFPLVLALMVGAFLMVQNRIDRRDPKLALAPIDADHETLTFS